MVDIREGNDGADDKSTHNQRPYISIYWKCCSVYSRVYRKPTSSSYRGHCPRCRAMVHVPVGKDGTNQRIFMAG